MILCILTIKSIFSQMYMTMYARNGKNGKLTVVTSGAVLQR